MKKWLTGLLFLVLCFGIYPVANAEMETDGFSNAVTITTAGSSVSHATDCTSLTATTDTICYEIDADVFYVCEPSAGDCDTAGEWKINAYVMKVGDTMTGLLNLDDVALTFEEGVDTMTITVPTLTAARAVTIPDQAGALMLDAGGTFTGAITTVGVAVTTDSTSDIGADATRYANIFTDSIDIGAVGASATLTSTAEDVLTNSGVYNGSAGTAGAPTYSFTGDTHTGFYSAGADQIGASIGGAAKFHMGLLGLWEATTIGWKLTHGASSSTVPVFSFNTDENTGMGRAAADELSLTAGGAEGVRVTATGVEAKQAQITAGSGTGLTVNEAGLVQNVVYKVTLDYTGLSAAALTAKHTIATLPAGTKIVGIIADTTTPYTGGAVSAATLQIGIDSGDTDAFLVDHDVLSGAVTQGDADAELGTLIIRANAVSGGYTNWAATTVISALITTVTANTDALTAGSTTYYIETVNIK